MIQYFCSGISLSCHLAVAEGLKHRNIQEFTSKLPINKMRERRSWNKGSLLIILWFHTRFGFLMPHWQYKEVLIFWIRNPHQLHVHTPVFAGVCVWGGGAITIKRQLAKRLFVLRWKLQLSQKSGLCHFKLEITKRMGGFWDSSLNQGFGLPCRRCHGACLSCLDPGGISTVAPLGRLKEVVSGRAHAPQARGRGWINALGPSHMHPGVLLSPVWALLITASYSPPHTSPSNGWIVGFGMLWSLFEQPFPLIIAWSVFILVSADKWILSESKLELMPALTSFHGCRPWSHRHCRGATFGSCLFCLASFCSPVLPICLRLCWMSDVLLSSEGWEEAPGPASWPLCLRWCQPPVISGLSLHLFHLAPLLAPLLCLCLLKTFWKVMSAFFASRLIVALMTPFWPSSMVSSQFQHWLYLFIYLFILPPFVLLPQNYGRFNNRTLSDHSLTFTFPPLFIRFTVEVCISTGWCLLYIFPFSLLFYFFHTCPDLWCIF